MTTTTGRRLTHAERAGIRYLAQSPQLGLFVSMVRQEHRATSFTRRVVYWPVVRQAARDSREAPNMWRCVTCDRLQPYFLKRCKACKRMP